jgi:hypothetical protein
VIVLLGAVTFIVGCFLPYWEITEPTSASLSFYRLIMPGTPRVTAGSGVVGGFLYLFGGTATLAWIAVAGVRGSRWTRPAALATATVVWSLTWIGSLLAINSLPVVDRGVGWWVLLLGVVVVVIGTIATWIGDRRAEASAQHVEDLSEG